MTLKKGGQSHRQLEEEQSRHVEKMDVLKEENENLNSALEDSLKLISQQKTIIKDLEMEYNKKKLSQIDDLVVEDEIDKVQRQILFDNMGSFESLRISNSNEMNETDVIEKEKLFDELKRLNNNNQ